MPKKVKSKLYTIGHSNHSLEDFLKLLEFKGIKKLVDVRSTPYSKYSPHFNKNNIKKSLESKGINYFYLGDKIGGRPTNKSYYKDKKVNYKSMEMDEKYREGIKNLEDIIEHKRTVLMCSEENPYQCHRHKLITHTLKERYGVIHIRGDGKEEDQSKQSTLI